MTRIMTLDDLEVLAETLDLECKAAQGRKAIRAYWDGIRSKRPIIRGKHT